MAVYRSAMGRQVDMSSMASQNEKTRAVGNMNVNARGDILDSNNRIVRDNTKRVRTGYDKTVTTAPKPKVEPKVQKSQLTKEEQMFEDDDEDFHK